MQRRTLVAVALASVLAFSAAAVYAGIGRTALEVPSVAAEASALRPLADERAAGWAEDAYLSRVHASEGAPLDGRVDPPLLYDTSPDPLVGDGRAVVWTFAYASPDKPGRAFFASVGGDGSVLYARDLPDPSHGCCVAVHHAEGSSLAYHEAYPSPPRVDFSVDASEAWAKVADEPEFATFALDHPVHQAFAELASLDGERSAWAISLRTATHYSARAVVDAATGEVLHLAAWPPVRSEPPTPPEPPCCCCEPGPWQPEDYHAEHEATLSSHRWWLDVAIPLHSRDHARELRVVAEVGDAIPHAEALVLEIYDGGGRQVWRGESSEGFEAVVTEFAGWGDFHAYLGAKGPLLREIPVRMAIDLTYGSEVRPPPTELRARGEVQGWGSEWWFPLDVAHAPVSGAVATLTWNRTLPTDNLELVLRDEMGNEVRSIRGEDLAQGASSLAMDVGPIDACCRSLSVRFAGAQPWPGVPFELHVKLAYDEPRAAALPD